MMNVFEVQTQLPWILDFRETFLAVSSYADVKIAIYPAGHLSL